MTEHSPLRRIKKTGARAGLITACQVGQFTVRAGGLLLVTWPTGVLRIGPRRRIEWTATPARKTIRIEPGRVTAPSGGVRQAPDEKR